MEKGDCMCGHSKDQHNGGLGLCNGMTYKYFCNCSRYSPSPGFVEKIYEINNGRHCRIIVQDWKGLVWETTAAEPFPTDDEVLWDFKTNKKKYFEPHYYKR